MIRMRVDCKIIANQKIKFTSDQSHYLFNVMRRKISDTVLIFNDYEEWECILDKISFIPHQLIRACDINPNKSIAISCIKSARMEIALEKLTEIGIDHIYLLATNRAQKVYYNYSRFYKITLEAAEQCNRLTIPIIHAAQSLENFLHLFPNNQFALMHQDGEAANVKFNFIPIIGPEGGFSPEEIELMKNINKISLGCNILRTETAAILAGSLIS